MMAALALGAACGTIRAEDDAPPPPPGGSAEARPDADGRGPKLTPEQREKVKAAMQKANADPRVQAARDDMKAALDDLQTVTHKAMLAQDATLAPTLQKLEQARAERREKMKGRMKERMAENGERPPGAGPGGPPPQGGDNDRPKRDGFRRGDGPGPRGGDPAIGDLPEDEREKLRAAHEKVKESAEVKAAKDRVEKSHGVNKEAMRVALIAADPSMAPIVDQILERFDRGAMGPGKGHHRNRKGDRD